MKSVSGALSSDPTASFLQGLEEAGYHPLVAQASGTIMFELTGLGVDDHWLVTIDKGSVGIANRPGPADAIVRMRRELFASAVRGHSNLWTAVLRNDLEVEGDLHLVMVFQRLLPGPPPDRNTTGVRSGER